MFSDFMAVCSFVLFLATPTSTIFSPSANATSSYTDTETGRFLELFKNNSRFWPLATNGERLPIRPPDLCGIAIKPRIIGGYFSASHDHPWIVSLRTYLNTHFCGGTIVTARHVLTAAHCVTLYKYIPIRPIVAVGAKTLKDGVRMYVEHILQHPEYGKRAAYDADLAIVQLKKDITFGPHIQPICLPDIDAVPPVGDTVIAGWGTTEEGGEKSNALSEVTVPILPPDACKAYKSLLTENMLCAGSVEGGVDACLGDSGGPMVQINETSGNAVLIGIISFGHGCGRPSFPGLYSRLDRFIEWILADV